MKGLLGIVALAAMFCGLMGCDSSPTNSEGVAIGEKKDDRWVVKDYGGAWFFRYVEVDGHEYLLMHGSHRSGITHSPKCPCLNKRMVFVVEQNQDIQFPNIGVELTDTYINCVTNKVIQK